MAPLLEAQTNYNLFTGRTIVPSWMEEDGREPGKAYRPHTNELAIMEQLNVSPMKIEHILKGYGGTLGTYVMDLIDWSLKSATVQGDNKKVMPARHMYDYPVIRRFLGRLNDRGMVEDLYDMHREAKKVTDTFNNLMKDGNFEDAEKYLKKRQMIMAFRKPTQKIADYLTLMRKRRDQITRSDLPAKTKQQQIDMLNAEVNLVLKGIVPEMKKKMDLPFLERLYR
jgi:hypothetical protein